MSDTTTYRALIIDDEPDLRDLMSITLTRLGIQCVEAEDIASGIKALTQQDFHFCLTDMKLPDGNGMDFIAMARKKYPRMPIAMITAYGNMEVAIEALKAGAFDFIAKPVDITKLRNTVNLAIKLTDVPVTTLINEQQSSVLIGKSQITETLKQQLIKAARSQAPTLLLGVNGTRKDEAAHLIHENSACRDGEFVTLNCEAYSEQELSDVLLGTDSQHTLSRAHGGSLFIRNISKLTASLQAKLMDFLQSKKLIINGESKELTFRLLCSDTPELHEASLTDNFRSDLYHHVGVISITLPTIQQRKEDLGMISQYFIQRYAHEWQMPEVEITAKAIQALSSLALSTDTVELESILKRAFTISESDIIEVEHIQPISKPEPNDASSETNQDGMMPINPNGDLESYLENIEREAIVQALEKNRWNKTVTAEHLGISFRTLRYRCKKLHID